MIPCLVSYAEMFEDNPSLSFEGLWMKKIAGWLAFQPSQIGLL
jgi:hypothetical protein